jgi:hypothetical protein
MGKVWTLEQQAEHRKVWVAALRSGEYKQGRNRLRNEDDTFCCLGVACDLAIKAGLENLQWGGPNTADPGGWVRSYRIEILDDLGMRFGGTMYLPTLVRDWLGLQHQAGEFEELETGTVKSLAALNDKGYTFEEIADLIETAPKGLIYNGD